jgi:DNA-binding MarR family transcriptional regulator
MDGTLSDLREFATATALAVPRFVGSAVLFHAAVADRLGVTATELHCLHLVHGGVSDSPTELARLLGMTTGAFTRLLDRMEEHRLAERAPDPADRRRLVVRPLPDRMAELAECYAPMAQFVGERLTRLDRRQLIGLLEFMTDGSAAAEHAAANLAAGDTTDVTHVISS